jgi:hypothetical protein
MKMSFEWKNPVLLTKNKKIIVTQDQIESIEEWPGVYYFARNHGATSTPFYIGETLTLRGRLKNHLATAKIADVLRGMPVAGAPAISNGPRSFHFAYLTGNKNKENAKKILQIAQKFMIEAALAADVPLLNSKLTVIKTHTLLFSGLKNFFEKENFIAAR